MTLQISKIFIRWIGRLQKLPGCGNPNLCDGNSYQLRNGQSLIMRAIHQDKNRADVVRRQIRIA